MAERAASSLDYNTNPIIRNVESTTLSEFGLYPEEPLLQNMVHGDHFYEEFSNHTPQRGGFIFLDNFRLPKSEQDTWGAVSNLDLFFTVRTYVHTCIHTYMHIQSKIVATL
jgi:hypothetical protein